MQPEDQSKAVDFPLMSLSKFQEGMGVSPTTTYRWRKKGWLHTVNIAGRHYILKKQFDEFLTHAEHGDFALLHSTFKRKRHATRYTMNRGGILEFDQKAGARVLR